MRSLLILLVISGLARADEPHLADLRQLTFGGENAEAYWSWQGDELILQARPAGASCDRIYRMEPKSGKTTPVSSGKGATTCSFFFPGDQEVLYSSTELGSPACPPRPDHSKGYVWALYDSYDIFRARRDGSHVERLTNTPGYDAEATVCGKGGSIIFTSTRDGDIDLYRMDKDGKNVKRLANTPGYDGGAFFNADCSKIVWRASRPKPGPELDDFRALLKQGLVRPTKLELYTANADGSEPTQLTYLDAASFGPYWSPDGKRILFSSNYGDPQGREFDIWSIHPDGTHLERVTHTPGFDGFPMFSPDGKYLAFSSNRATAPGKHDTNVFIARWVEDAKSESVEQPGDRIAADVSWLADPARQGRGIGTSGLEAAGEFLEKRFAALGMKSNRQWFPVVTSVKAKTSKLVVDGQAQSFQPLGFSAEGRVRAPIAFAGYGVVAPELGIDDYKGIDALNKIVVVRRFVSDKITKDSDKRRYGDLRHKAWIAREHGAKAIIVVDIPEKPARGPSDWPAEAHLPALIAEGYGNAGILVAASMRGNADWLRAKIGEIEIGLETESKQAFNVIATLPADAKQKTPGAIVIGAHYDHLGMGGRFSLEPDAHAAHGGADDNASGTATMLEIARGLAGTKERTRDLVFIGFSGEESGILGSTYFTKHPPPGLAPKNLAAMINLDMVGRLRANQLNVMGTDSATEWGATVVPACEHARVECTTGGDGYGPSDMTPFYAAGVPVIFFFTGAHADYHKPSDTADKLNAAGAAQVASIVREIVATVPAKLTYKSVPAPPPRGDMRSFNASLGTVPDYAGPGQQNGGKGVLLAGVRKGGAAEAAGMRRGDILIRLGAHEIGSVEDLMYALNASHPGETVAAIIIREGQKVELKATFQETKRQ